MAFRLRFRHSFTLIPHFLKFTLNKKSWSLNMTIGPYSRSWGSARSTTTIDAPGALGFSWREEHSHGDGGFDTLWILLIAVFCLLTVPVQTGLLMWQQSLQVGPAAAIAGGAGLGTLLLMLPVKRHWWSLLITALLCAATAGLILWL
jgi:hypothetical protein